MTLAEVEAVYARWFAGNDRVPLRAALAAYVANEHLDGDPVWVMLVGGSGRGKTEHATPLAKLPHVRIISTLTGEAALLSGTPRKDTSKGATGGILCQLGDHGMLVIKDFTSIISMHRDARAQVLAALREIYDGQWSREIGADGGRTLTWSGKLGVLACCTSLIDRAHAVMAAMGDRFLLVRLPDEDRPEVGLRALRQAGREQVMRSELGQAVAGITGKLGKPHIIGSDLETRLVSLADLVSLARSPVERDYQGELELVLDAEAPTRIVKALAQIYRACGRLGLDPSASWEVVIRLALDSIPKLRRAALEHLERAEHPVPITHVASGCAHPLRSVRRALEDLEAHGLVIRGAGGAGKADSWQLSAAVTSSLATARTVPETSDTAPETSQTVPETSDTGKEHDDNDGAHPSVNHLHHVYDDIPGKVPHDTNRAPRATQEGDRPEAAHADGATVCATCHQPTNTPLAGTDRRLRCRRCHFDRRRAS
jgi:hypothetical protein